MTPMEHKGTFCGIGQMSNLDWGGGYTGCAFLKSHKKSIHKICNLLSFVNYSSIKLTYLKYFYIAAAIKWGYSDLLLYLYVVMFQHSGHSQTA